MLLRRRAVLLCATFAVLLALPSAASAARVLFSEGTILVIAKPGEVNTIRLTDPDAVPDPFASTGRVIVSDSTTPPVAGWGCTAITGGVLCPSSTRPIVVRVNDLDDSVEGDSYAEWRHDVHVYGSSGNDTISLSPWIRDTADAALDGGPGADTFTVQSVDDLTITGGSGNDTASVDDLRALAVRGGQGADDVTLRSDMIGAADIDLGPDDDVFRGAWNARPGSVIDGGPGYDQALLGALSETVDLATCPGGCSFEKVVGTEFDDTILGSDAREWFIGRGGNDTLDPRGGSDLVEGGAGADTITTAGDKDVDAVFCGDDVDTVTADPFDIVAVSCEV